MIGRMLRFLIVFAPIGLIAIYFISLLEEQDIWLIGLGVYFFLGIIIGNLYIFGIGSDRRRGD